jgi:hypothetical protein
MSEQMTPLRRRMVDKMALRNMAPLTHQACAVKNFNLLSTFTRQADFRGRSNLPGFMESIV